MGHSRNRFLFLLALSLSVFPCSAIAEGPPSPFRGEVRYASSIRDLVDPSRVSSLGVSKLSEPVRLTISSKKLGNLEVFLNKEWKTAPRAFFDTGVSYVEDTSKPIFLRGTIKIRDGDKTGPNRVIRRRIAGALFDLKGKYQYLTLSFAHGVKGKRYYEVKIPIVEDSLGSRARISSVPSLVLNGLVCGESNLGHSVNEASLLEGGISGNSAEEATIDSTLKVIQISTDADYDWFLEYGSNSNSQIRSILNSVQTIYERDLELTFSVVLQAVVTSSSGRYTSTNSLTLLEQFQDYTLTNNHLGSADVYHLFSGKDLDNDVIGIAYTGVMCLDPDFSFGLTQHVVSALDPIITAHEIGHNLSASHDNATTPGTIMTTSLNPSAPPTEFSQTSKNQINAHVGAFGSCLATQSATPTPTPTATPGGGGGGSGGSGGGGGSGGNVSPPSPISLTATLTNQGVFSAQVDLLEPAAGCTVELRTATKKNSSMIGGIIASFGGDYSTTTYSTVINRKSLSFTSDGRRARVFVVAKLDCDGTISYSEVSTLRPSKIKSKQSPLAVNRWIRTLKNGLASIGPVQGE